jgi:CHAT domain-containing protein
MIPPSWDGVLNNVDQVILVPHGLIGDLPLHALPIRWLGDRSLLESARVTYLPGLALAHRLRQASEGDLALVVANAAEPPGLVPSEFEKEAGTIGRVVGTEYVYTGSHARAEYLAEFGSRAYIVHIAAHGVYNPADPLGSALLLSDGGTGVTPLTARDVLGLPIMPGPLVVLSGCETSRHLDDLQGEGEGLVRAFFLVGARAVIAGQWSVDSATTRRLMETFYTEFQASGEVAGSLRQAALTVKGSSDTSHPYYWAPFVMTGV